MAETPIIKEGNNGFLSVDKQRKKRKKLSPNPNVIGIRIFQMIVLRSEKKNKEKLKSSFSLVNFHIFANYSK
ncbi:MAG TPA: hypothetical protein ENJ53_01480 [Phaeodactylibacter sp.]|nr:hypothetical protein [Phaeodactylibacter sp.]